MCSLKPTGGFLPVVIKHALGQKLWSLPSVVHEAPPLHVRVSFPFSPLLYAPLMFPFTSDRLPYPFAPLSPIALGIAREPGWPIVQGMVLVSLWCRHQTVVRGSGISSIPKTALCCSGWEALRGQQQGTPPMEEGRWPWVTGDSVNLLLLIPMMPCAGGYSNFICWPVCTVGGWAVKPAVLQLKLSFRRSWEKAGEGGE